MNPKERSPGQVREDDERGHDWRRIASDLLRLGKLLRPHWGEVLRPLKIGALAAMLSVPLPYLTKLFIDEVYPSRNASLLTILAAGVLAFSLGAVCLTTARGYLAQYANVRLAHSFSLMLFNHVQHLPLGFFENRRTGDVISRVGESRGVLVQVAGQFQTLFISGMYILAIVPVMLALDWRLTFLALSAVPVTLLLSAATSAVRRRQWRRLSEAMAELTSFYIETLTQIKSLKALALEQYTFGEADKLSQRVIRWQLRAFIWSTSVSSANGVARAIATTAFTWYAWRLILGGQLTLGTFMAFSAYLGYLLTPIGQLTGLLTSIQQSSVSMHRAIELLDEQPEESPLSAIQHRESVGGIDGGITFHGVSHRYENGTSALSDVSFTIPPGTVTCVLGESGAGKSTLLRLILLLDQPSSGDISFGSRSARSLAPSELRRHAAVVWQDPGLIGGTFWDALTVGQNQLSEELVHDAIRTCCLSDVIEVLPDGLQSRLGEGASKLSAGQRQRLALARALLRGARLLLLDEATSHLDPVMEHRILNDLIRRLRGQTLIYVTHRIQTANLADRVLLFERGRLVGNDSPRELSRSCPQFRSLMASVN